MDEGPWAARLAAPVPSMPLRGLLSNRFALHSGVTTLCGSTLVFKVSDGIDDSDILKGEGLISSPADPSPLPVEMPILNPRSLYSPSSGVRSA